MPRESLLLKFIHKPSRSNEFFEKAQDQTRRNLLINSQIGHDLKDDLKELESSDHETTQNESECSTKGSFASVISARATELTPITSNTLSDPEPGPEPDYELEHALIRKKSGEIVKPLLKEGLFGSYFDRKRTRSLPSTPTYKLVHFGGDTDVRYFKQKDKPTAISAQNSPNASDEEDTDEADQSDLDIDAAFEEDLHRDLDRGGSTRFSKKASAVDYVNWQLQLPNFPDLSYEKKVFQEKAFVFLERMFISIDQKFLLGHIAVKNISFQKSILVRYTLDRWLTIIEIPTIYVPDTPQILKKNEYDRFIFKIPLYNLFNTFGVMLQNQETPKDITEKHFELCVKFGANDHEYWDNNYTQNYKLILKKIPKAFKQKTLQITAHANKPRYLLSYLRRRLSDLEIVINLQENHQNANDETVKGDEKKNNGNEKRANVDANETMAAETQSKNLPENQFSNIDSTNNYTTETDTYFPTSPATHTHSNNFRAGLNSNLNLSDSRANSTYLISPVLAMRSDFKSNPLHLNLEVTQQDDTETIQDGEISPDTKDKFSPTVAFKKLSKKLHKEAKKAMDSKSYKDLLNTYCFFSKEEDENEKRTQYIDNRLNPVSSALGFQG